MSCQFTKLTAYELPLCPISRLMDNFRQVRSKEPCLSLSPLVFLTVCSSSASFFLSIFFIIFLFFVACPQLTISGIGLIYAFTAPLVSSPSCCCIVSYRTVAVRERSMARLLTATTLVRSKFLLVSLFSYWLKYCW